MAVGIFGGKCCFACNFVMGACWTVEGILESGQLESDVHTVCHIAIANLGKLKRVNFFGLLTVGHGWSAKASSSKGGAPMIFKS